jgi:tetratricopeptide (TPR) repeat protein
MRRVIYHTLLIFGTVIVSAGCTRKAALAGVTVVGENSYDTAKFNYVYVEAIKQKLMGNGGEALKRLEEAIEMNPESDAAYYQMAQILSANGDMGNARKFLNKALSIDEKNIWYLMMMGGFYYQDKNIDSAIFYYENAVKYFPDEEDLQLTLGNLYSENKNYDKAIKI